MCDFVSMTIFVPKAFDDRLRAIAKEKVMPLNDLIMEFLNNMATRAEYLSVTTVPRTFTLVDDHQ